MSARYAVFRGPGNRLVAISASPQRGQWIVRSGEEGKRLRHAQSPVSLHPDFDAVRAAHIDDDYQLLFTGVIDSYGRSADSSASLVYWEATSTDPHALSEQLRQFAQSFPPEASGFRFVDDVTGCTVRFGRSIFGVTRAITPGCISFDGSGSDALSMESGADLLCLVASLAEACSIRLADASGQTLTAKQVLSRCSASASAPMAAYLRARGHAPLALTLRTLNKRAQIRF